MKILENGLKNAFLLLCVVFLAACEEPFTPEVLEGNNNFLVVSGFINSNGPTTISLSRTQNLSENGGPVMEEDATVMVEEENGAKFPLLETTPGTYTSPYLLINSTKKYRLVIKADGKDYESDFVEVKQTPAIDSINWKAESDGLQFYVNSHDPNNNTVYYRWEYEETWEYRAYYHSWLEYIDGKIVDRSPENDIYLCWPTSSSTQINMSNTVKLGQDVISNFPLLKLPTNSNKLISKYSILVKQYAQTKEASEYWEALKKNTESIGSLFDPLPTQLVGNIRCLTSPVEPVIGFVEVCSVEEKRIFVTRPELPTTWSPQDIIYCEQDTIPVNEVADYFSSGTLIPIDRVYSTEGMSKLIGYRGAGSYCTDCRNMGTNIKPDFWQ
ncbi:DUF4249 domain-containing protein [Rufibacter latericius]|uniref:DUF4249 domain-containing protein n=1 Tax=Rufibacter latericius TaxID=2487040 RepID=A0A3M9MAE6_9BACT|nr:DUF4249 domain-containing protein [Rufibacter latericius]RNI22540.1 DUF4249 domain-containing protein [Rufibacter latericius]